MDGINQMTTPEPGPVANPENDIMEAVRRTAMLVQISISSWTAMKSDKQRVEDLKRQHHAVGDVGRFQKNLLTGADLELKAVLSAQAAVRSFHYELTMPWITNPHARKKDGPGLLPNQFFHEYVRGYSERKRAADEALDKFIDVYKDNITRAQQNLGGMADTDYPSPDEVRAMFSVTVDFQPVPEAAGFRGLPTHTLEQLGKALHQRQTRMLGGALQKMWGEARERLEHLAERLTEPDPGNPLSDSEWGKRFKTSTIGNVKELLGLMPGWNLTKQPEVDVVVTDIKDLLTYNGHEITREDLVGSTQARGVVARKVEVLLNKFNQWGV